MLTRQTMGGKMGRAKGVGMAMIALVALVGCADPTTLPAQEMEPDAALAAVEAAGFVAFGCDVGICLGYDGATDVDAALRVLAAHWRELDVEAINGSIRANGGFDAPASLARTSLAIGRLTDKPTSLEPLRGMPLVELHMGNASAIASLEPLRGMELRALRLSNAARITSLEPLQGMPLTWLSVGGATGVTSLEPLRGMPLTALDLSDLDGVTSLEPLRGMKLTDLYLQDADGITSLEPLAGMPLTWLDLWQADGITSLAPLDGINPDAIANVSDALVATLDD